MSTNKDFQLKKRCIQFLTNIFALVVPATFIHAANYILLGFSFFQCWSATSNALLSILQFVARMVLLIKVLVIWKKQSVNQMVR